MGNEYLARLPSGPSVEIQFYRKDVARMGLRGPLTADQTKRAGRTPEAGPAAAAFVAEEFPDGVPKNVLATKKLTDKCTAYAHTNGLIEKKATISQTTLRRALDKRRASQKI
jgi:hypothetical protein